MKADVLSCLHEVKLWNFEIRVILLLKPDLGPDLQYWLWEVEDATQVPVVPDDIYSGLPVFTEVLTTKVEEDYGGVWIPLTM